jgi:hypothetical protein
VAHGISDQAADAIHAAYPRAEVLVHADPMKMVKAEAGADPASAKAPDNRDCSGNCPEPGDRLAPPVCWWSRFADQTTCCTAY